MVNEKRLIWDVDMKTAFREWFDHEDFRTMNQVIDDIPTVDAVEVPCRCKECKYWKHFDHIGCTEFVKVCTLAYYMIGENGYCLYGERREDNA